MKLKDLKKTWDRLTRRRRLEIIENSNSRRLEAFRSKKKKGRKKSKKKKKKSKKSRKRSKSTPTTAEGLMKLKEKMTDEEWENFKLMVSLQEDD